MKLLVCCSEKEKELFSTASKEVAVSFSEDIATASGSDKFDAVIHLLFENNKERITKLSTIADLVVVNSLVETLNEIHPSFIRINGWPGLLNALLIEASALEEKAKEKAVALFQHLGKNVKWVDDEPGFISARIISMIINEAYFALAEGVSTKEDIDIAMKLGTAYPHGPFEWAGLIGLGKVAHLLTKLSRQEPRYSPAPLLLAEAAL